DDAQLVTSGGQKAKPAVPSSSDPLTFAFPFHTSDPSRVRPASTPVIFNRPPQQPRAPVIAHLLQPLPHPADKGRRQAEHRPPVSEPGRLGFPVFGEVPESFVGNGPGKAVEPLHLHILYPLDEGVDHLGDPDQPLLPKAGMVAEDPSTIPGPFEIAQNPPSVPLHRTAGTEDVIPAEGVLLGSDHHPPLQRLVPRLTVIGHLPSPFARPPPGLRVSHIPPSVI